MVPAPSIFLIKKITFFIQKTGTFPYGGEGRGASITNKMHMSKRLL